MKRIFLIIFIASIIALTCTVFNKDEDDQILSKNIVFGEDTVISTTTITSSGGEINISGSGTSIDGMKIEVPTGAYGISKTFTISYAPIESHILGEDFNPITPLIKIDNGGTFADSIISVSIPISITSDEFAMAFFYDEFKGQLEGMPIIELAEDHITVGTKHFSNVIVSKILNSKLTGNATTEFEPGYDDWQFPNHGSFIAAKGHCAGQAITALWYYCEKERNGAHYLNGYYDNDERDDTPKLWEDDAMPYKLCSVIQRVINWSSYARTYWKKLNKLGDTFTLKAFEYSIKLTQEPQYVEIWNTADSSGHAMVIYGVSGNSLLVADPNYPGNTTRKIIFSGSKFQPYNSGADVDAIEAGYTINFDGIVYVGKSAIIPFETLQQGWDAMEAKTIGGKDWFPTYILSYKSFETNELIAQGDSFGVVSPKFKINKTLGGPEEPLGWMLYKNQEVLEYNDETEWELEPGLNEIGVNVLANVNDSWEWYDFFYFKVFYDDTPVIGNINPAQGYPGMQVAVSGRNFLNQRQANYVIFGNIPANDYSLWSDSLIVVTIPNGLDGKIPVQIVVNGKESKEYQFMISGSVRPFKYDWFNTLGPQASECGDSLRYIYHTDGSISGADSLSDYIDDNSVDLFAYCKANTPITGSGKFTFNTNPTRIMIYHCDLDSYFDSIISIRTPLTFVASVNANTNTKKIDLKTNIVNDTLITFEFTFDPKIDPSSQLKFSRFSIRAKIHAEDYTYKNGLITSQDIREVEAGYIDVFLGPH